MEIQCNLTNLIQQYKSIDAMQQCPQTTVYGMTLAKNIRQVIEVNELKSTKESGAYADNAVEERKPS